MERIRPEILRCALLAALWLGLVLYQSCRLWRSFIAMRGLRFVSTWSGFSSLTPCSISTRFLLLFLRCCSMQRAGSQVAYFHRKRSCWLAVSWDAASDLSPVDSQQSEADSAARVGFRFDPPGWDLRNWSSSDPYYWWNFLTIDA